MKALMDEATGAAGYMICGGLHGENTIVNGGSLTQIVHNLVHLYEKLLTFLKLMVVGGSISMGLGAIKAALFMLAAMDKILILACIAYPLSAFLFVIGISIVYIGLVFLITVLEGFYATLPRRIWKKEYAYT